MPPVFDMDGTLLSSNIIETYLWMRLPELDPAERLREIGRLLPDAVVHPGRARDRGGFLRAVYRRYAGAGLAELDTVVDEVLTATCWSGSRPAPYAGSASTARPATAPCC